MSAQILLFPANRIRRLVSSGVMSSDMVLIGMASKIPRVEYNRRLDLMYEVCDKAIKRKKGGAQ